MEKTANKKNKDKKKLSKGAIVLIIGLVIIAIPCLVFGWILLSAYLQTGKPVIGSRFDNDLNPSITSAQTSTIESSVSGLAGVEKCTVEMKSAQYRVNVDTSDSLSSEQIKDLVVNVYNTVNSTLPVGTYFTATDTMKMYDLSINVYNFINAENENMIYYILTKNSKMPAYTIQCVSEPLNEDLAKELRGETDIETGVGDASIEGEEVEE
ncbi:MAG: hypothetical protein IJJ00_00025 [Erysipelotrichaceae bacterium]|nr:hypothetical protein [Erysipelotrichaceae bacterium]